MKFILPSKTISPFWEFVQSAFIALLLSQGIVHFVIQPHHVLGASMEPNFTTGDRILTDKISYKIKDPTRGDVIVFHPPGNENSEYIKRIIGLPGDTVEFREGSIYINGSLLEEKYLPYETSLIGISSVKGAQEVIIPEGQYLVLGDNRANSYDSRHFGLIERSDIEGEAIIRYWPFHEIEFISPD